jgi:hypothetical protein
MATITCTAHTASLAQLLHSRCAVQCATKPQKRTCRQRRPRGPPGQEDRALGLVQHSLKLAMQVGQQVASWRQHGVAGGARGAAAAAHAQRTQRGQQQAAEFAAVSVQPARAEAGGIM